MVTDFVRAVSQRPDNGSVIPVNDFLPSALAEVLRKAPLTTEKVAFAWRQAVGPAVDRATEIALDGAVLRVRASSVQWQREVERSAGLIRSRLDVLLGAGVVRGLNVTTTQNK
jgi:hypothetical protein